MKLWNSRPRAPFVLLVAGALPGIIIADHFTFPAELWMALTGALGILTWLIPRPWICAIFALTTFGSLHTLRLRSEPASAMSWDSPRETTLRGIVSTEPEIFPQTRGEPQCRFQLEIQSMVLADCTAAPQQCQVRWKGPAPAYGDEVFIQGQAAALPPARNPGEFDTVGWLQRQGIYFQVETSLAKHCRILAHDKGRWEQHFAIKARVWLSRVLEQGLEDAPEISTLIQSMVLGMQNETPFATKAIFQKTGTLHLFAVSGLNVAMLAGIAWYLLKIIRVPKRLAVLPIALILIAYALVTGLGASSVRATIMALCILGAAAIERRAVSLNSIAAAAIIILAWNTNELFSPGFQFSFVLVQVIMCTTRPLQCRLEPFGRPDEFIPRSLWSNSQRWISSAWNAFAGAASVTIAAWLGSLLFSAGYFHLFAPASLLANFLAVPLAFLILSLGLGAVLGSIISPVIVVLFNNANWAIAKILLWIVAACARLPGGHVYVETPSWKSQAHCELTVFDFGNGGAMHIRADGLDWLLDCGHERNYPRTLLPYLRSRGINQLEGLILTHGDAAHLGAAPALLEDFHPRWIADTQFTDHSPAHRKLHATLSERRIGKRFLMHGDTLQLSGSVRLRVLFPPAHLNRGTADDRAVVLKLECANTSILLTSDSGFPTERWLLEHEPSLRADVLIMGWHTKERSGTPGFIHAISPRLVIATQPPFGKPDISETLDTPGNTVVWHQKKCGAATVNLYDDGHIQARSFLGKQQLMLGMP